MMWKPKSLSLCLSEFNLNGAESRVFIAMSDKFSRTDPTQNCSFGTTTLGDMTLLSTRTVKRAKAGLIEKGVIQRVGVRKGDYAWFYCYQLTKKARNLSWDGGEERGAISVTQNPF